MTETKFEIEIFVLIILNHHLSQNFKIIRKNEFKYRLINIYIYIYIYIFFFEIKQKTSLLNMSLIGDYT
jgi:hypothetical protein